MNVKRMYSISKQVYNVATCWELFGKTNNLLVLSLRAIFFYPILFFLAFAVIGALCQFHQELISRDAVIGALCQFCQELISRDAVGFADGILIYAFNGGLFFSLCVFVVTIIILSTDILHSSFGILYKNHQFVKTIVDRIFSFAHCFNFILRLRFIQRFNFVVVNSNDSNDNNKN